ncbi:FAD binding domain-containing protein [Microbacterium hominis]|uniref:Xanthine dehydrogenase family protein subunit M n=1 Tax=Microbacterium hominis TaxID=162426 RepID=A0A7D4PNG3_9MICO|nr:xanthine dehydrogenase family protein subunit M [Microbacterium hominis]QKJ20255.1 xanthine dehydrogenase family protein subunit M [Microbacterium hominis]
MQIPAPFDYAKATSVDDAIALLDRYGEEARVIAGGHSILPMMKLRLARPEWLIDINDLTDLDYIRREGDMLHIGALTRHHTLLESAEVHELFPIITDAEKVVADPIVRNRGTIGGSLCQADPAEDLSTVCTVIGAQAVIKGQGGERVLSMDEFHVGPYETAVAHNEVLIGVRLPIRPRTSSAYEKVERRVGDWAVAAAGAAVTLGEDGSTLEDVALGVTAIGRTDRIHEAEEILRGKTPTDELVAEAGRAMAASVDPVADQRGSIAYKRHLADELMQRVLLRALHRAHNATTGNEG